GLALAVLAPRDRHGAALALLATQQLVGDGGWTIFIVHAESLRMRIAAPGTRARVAAGGSFLSVGMRLLGAAARAALATPFDVRLALASGTVISALALALCFQPALARDGARSSSTT